MYFPLLLALPLLCHVQASTTPVQNATQASELAFLAQFLTMSGDNAFVNATNRIIGTPAGDQFVADLVNVVTGNDSSTIFIPNNIACTPFLLSFSPSFLMSYLDDQSLGLPPKILLILTSLLAFFYIT